MASITAVWSNVVVEAPGDTVIDHADVDLLDGTGSIAMSIPGKPASGLPASSVFDSVPVGTGYVVRLRNFSLTGQFGADVLTNPVDVVSTTINVTVVGSGVASVA